MQASELIKAHQRHSLPIMARIWPPCGPGRPLFQQPLAELRATYVRRCLSNTITAQKTSPGFGELLRPFPAFAHDGPCRH